MANDLEILNSETTADFDAVLARKVRFGRTDWAVWRDANGTFYAARLCAASIKAAMLATGTKRKWTIYSAGSGRRFAQSWRLGCLLLRNTRRFGLAA